MTENNDRYISSREAAQFLGLSLRCLDEWRRQSKGPPFVRFSPRCIRYRLSTLEVFLKQRTIQFNNNQEKLNNDK